MALYQSPLVPFQLFLPRKGGASRGGTVRCQAKTWVATEDTEEKRRSPRDSFDGRPNDFPCELIHHQDLCVLSVLLCALCGHLLIPAHVPTGVTEQSTHASHLAHTSVLFALAVMLQQPW